MITAAGVLFEDWTAVHPLAIVTRRVAGVRGYVPGRFYHRELPAVLTLLDDPILRPHTILIYRIPTLLKMVDQAARGRRFEGGQDGESGA